MCGADFFHLGLLSKKKIACACYLLRGIFFSLSDAHPPTHTYPPTLQGFCWRASLHTEMLVGGGWCWLDDIQRFSLQKWLHFGDSRKSNDMLPFDFVHNPVWEIHTSAGIPPSLLLPVAWTTNLVGHNITSFVDRHKKSQTSKGLAWRLNKSAFNSANV